MTTPGVAERTWSRDLVVVDADALLVTALKRIRESTAAVVVVTRGAGECFAFRQDEILRHPGVRGWRLLLSAHLTIGKALRLRGAEQSRTTRYTEPPDPPARPTHAERPEAPAPAPSASTGDPQREGREPPGPSALRVVLVNELGQPVAVSGPGIGARSERRAAAVRPPRSGPLPSAVPPPRSEPPPATVRPPSAEPPPATVQPPTRDVPREAPTPRPSIGDRADDLEEMTSGAEPPGDEPAADAADEATSATRFPSIDPDGPPRPGSRIVITVDLTSTRTASTAGDAMTFEPGDREWTELTVHVQLVCTAIAFDVATGRIIVRRGAASTPAVITGTVNDGERVGGTIDVSAVFMHEGRFSGTAVRRLTVEPKLDADAPMPVTGVAAPAPPQPPGPPAPPVPPDSPSRAGPPGGGDNGGTQGALLVEVGAEPPDLTVQVMVPDKSFPGRLLWLVQPRELFDELPASLEGSCDVGRDAESYMTKLFGQYAELERGKHQRRLEGFGEELWEKVPECFRATYWAMWDRYARPLTIQFVSAEPNLPWELMRPSRPGTQHPILALKHPVARWIASYRSYLRNRLPAGGLFTIAPHYRSASARLQRAEVEAKRLVEELGATRVDGTYDAVLALLEGTSAPPGVSLLHFAGHGKFSAGSADSSTIKLEDGSLAVSEVAREAVQLGVRCRTVVFFNACEVGATGAALGAVGGWADAFLGRRFGGFIAPLWAVDDEDAAIVSAELLEGIVVKREPVGAVLQGIRAKYGDVSPTFFSYLYYGDVTARVGGPAIV